MNKKDIQERINCMENDLAILKDKLNQPEEDDLKPYDWSDKERFEIDGLVWLCTSKYSTPLFFTFESESDAQSFSDDLKLMSLILNLKKSLGDDILKGDASSHSVYFDSERNQFRSLSRLRSTRVIGGIEFNTWGNAQKVCDYLNKNWKWSS